MKSPHGVNNAPLFSGQPIDFSWTGPAPQWTNNIHRATLRRAFLRRDLGVRIDAANEENWVAYSDTKIVRFFRSMPSMTSKETIRIGHDKHLTKEFLKKQAVPVPAGITISADDEEKAIQWLQSAAGPIVVKPLQGSFGDGVSLSISNSDTLIAAMKCAGTSRVVLEEMVEGSDHRLFVLGGVLLAAARRLPAAVIGNGIFTVEELIKQKNKTRSQVPYLRDGLIKFDTELHSLLKEQEITLETIPGIGQKIALRRVANISRGGDSEDVTQTVHPDYHDLARTCWLAFPGMAFAGIDLIAEDISKPIESQRISVIEININCDIALHLFPSIPSETSSPVDVADAIVQYIFPDAGLGETIAKKIKVTGKVQGVGYRSWIQAQARLLGVRGTVWNTKDGDVGAKLEGTRSAVQELFMRCVKGPKDAVVKQVEMAGAKVENSVLFEIGT